MSTVITHSRMSNLIVWPATLSTALCPGYNVQSLRGVSITGAGARKTSRKDPGRLLPGSRILLHPGGRIEINYVEGYPHDPGDCTVHCGCFL